MVWLKADSGLENTYKKLIYASKADVEWNGCILAQNNTIILPGSINSLIFDFELKKVYANIIDIPAMPADIFETEGRQMIKNIFNLLLYIFGKWGAIQGIRVEHTYGKIDLLLKQVLKEAGAEAYYSANGIKFTCDGKSVVFEDVIMSAINKIKEKERAAEEGMASEDEEEGYPQGLWHDMKWKMAAASFNKQDLDDDMRGKDRLGGNFYTSPYKCPGCGGHLHMSVYPDGKEIVIDTEEGRVYAARVYMCPACSIFYTPRPGKLLSEGDEYILDFDKDVKAAEDYRKLIGRNGGKNSNSNTNMYEHEYAGKVHNGNKSLARICRNISRLSIAELERLLGEIDEGFYRESEIKRFLEYIKQELEYRMNEQLDPYTAFRKGLKSGKIGEDGVAGGIERHRMDYSGIEDEEEADNTMPDNEETEDDDTEEDSVMEDIIRRYIGNGGISKDDTQDTEESPSGVEDVTESKTEGVREDNATEGGDNTGGNGYSTDNMEAGKSRHPQNKRDKNVEKTGKAKPSKSLFNKKRKPGNAASEAEDSPEESSNIEEGINEDTISSISKDEDNQDIGNNQDNVQNITEEKETTYKRGSILSREEAIKKISAARKYQDTIRLLDEVKNSGLSSEDKEEFIRQLNEILVQAGKKELDYLISHLPQSDSRDRYKRVKERIQSYKDIDISKYEEIIDKYIQNAEREELSAMAKKAGNDRRSLLNMLEDIKNKDFEVGVLKEYSDEIYQRVKDIDMETVRKIVPNMSALDVSEGIRAMEEIEKADILPELKKEMTELIDKKLTRMKTEESEQLVEKIQRNLESRIENLSRIHYYDARKMLNGDNKDEESLLIRRAISKYAVLLGKYEYPVIICDSSLFNNGKEGFIISPDHIFYKGVIKSGTLDVMDIDNISLENGKAGKAVFVNSQTKRKVKLPCPFKGKDQESLAQVLDEFVEYLKAKPKSRSVEYMAQKKHLAICCYRCGHVFKSGNICPKCGSRN